MRSKIEIAPLILSIVASSLAALVGYKWYQRKRLDGKQSSSLLSTSGSIYSQHFLATVRPLYDLRMGCENMGPMLYSLLRFLKPNRVLEVGAGYTSIYLLHALKDNVNELEAVARAKSALGGGDYDQLMEDMFLNAFQVKKSTPSALHIMDNMKHESTTADLVMEIAKELKCSESLKVIVADCFDYQLEEKYDFIWFDEVSPDATFPALFDNYWNKHLNDGGYIAVHSTLTNTVTRKWMTDLSNRRQPQQEMLPVRFEVKPRNSEVNLKSLSKSLQEIGEGNLEWQGNYRLAPLTSGLQKLILSALAKDFDTAKDAAKKMVEQLDAQVGSLAVLEDEDSPPRTTDFQFVSFLEPHKRFQNSFSIFQKRTSNYREKVYSWSS